jgi:hypothetical protein
MKIILSEEQFRRIILNDQMAHKSWIKDILITEQNSPFGGHVIYPSYQATKHLKEPIESALKSAKEYIIYHRHTILDIAALISFEFPPLASALELVNAGLYFREDEKLLGAISVIFAFVPVLGAIPGVKQAIAFAIKKGVKYSLQQIKKVIKFVSANIKYYIKYMKLLYTGISKAVKDKAKRMLSQKWKMAGDNVDEMIKVYQEYIDGLIKMRYVKGGSKAGKLGAASGRSVTVYSDAISKGVKLTLKQKKYIVSHEMDHIYNNTVEEGLDWLKAFDTSKWPDKTKSYFGTYRNPIYKKAGAETTTKGFNLGGKYRTYDELRARGGQLKDFIAFKRKIPLKQDFKIIMSDLDYALKNFVKETGLDNSMTIFINSISDKQHLLKLMNKYALGTAGIVALTSEWDYGYDSGTSYELPRGSNPLPSDRLGPK